MVDKTLSSVVRLFSESTSRFLCEVAVQDETDFQALFEEAGVPAARVGQTNATGTLRIRSGDHTYVNALIGMLKEAWQRTLRY